MRRDNVSRYYIASSLDNIAEVRKLMLQMSRELPTHEVTYDWTKHGSVQALADKQGKEVFTKTATGELAGVDNADYVIVLLPGGRGTHVELGAALARRRQVFLIDPAGKGLKDESGRECAFYYAKGILRHVGEAKDVIPLIRAWEMGKGRME